VIPDIVVQTADGSLGSRVTLHADGTVRYGHEARFGSQLYRTGAFLPKGSPRAGSAPELAILDARNAPRGRNHTIGIVQLPRDLVAALRSARAAEGRIALEALRAFPFDRIPGALAPHWRVDGELLPLGYARNPPGFHTVTFDAGAQRFIGLHIDDLDALPLARREDSTSRVCVNLGEEARYLLFVNLGTARMAQMVSGRADGGEALGLRSTPLIHAFLESFPRYPVVRLAVFPGEAYVAPTENMIHDGSTLGMAAEDQQVTLRGRFEPT
jgi:hypothetical protein